MHEISGKDALLHHTWNKYTTLPRTMPDEAVVADNGGGGGLLREDKSMNRKTSKSEIEECDTLQHKSGITNML